MLKFLNLYYLFEFLIIHGYEDLKEILLKKS